MMNLIATLLIPFFTALLCLGAWNRRKLQMWATVAGMGLMVFFSSRLLINVREHGIATVQAGNWSAPFGITIIADLFSSIMLVMTALVGFCISLYSIASVDKKRQEHSYYPLYNFLIFGVTGAFLAGDMFNMYVWFEIMLISSFVLLALGGTKKQLEGAIKYVTLNLISSGVFLAGVAILYSLTGSLNMADIAAKLGHFPQKGLVTVAAMFFLIAFGIKAAVFPLFFWLPASYHTPPISIAAVFSGLLTKVGVYALIRVFTLIFVLDISYTHTIIMIVSALTMVIGVLGTAVQFDFRRILSFHIISQIGYLIMGLAIFTPLAIAGSIFFIMHIILVKTVLFLVSGIVHHLKGSFNLKKLGGIYRDYPWLSFLFLLPALSLAGIPPLSGFWAKIVLAKAAIDADLMWLVLTALGVSLLTLFSMSKIWNQVFWTNDPKETDGEEQMAAGPGPLWLMLVPVVFLVVCILLIGFYTGPFFNIAYEAAHQLLNREEYIDAVLKR